MGREIDLFKGVSKKFMGEVKKIMKKETCEKGAVLFKTGDPAKNFFILQEGRISICAEDRGHAVSFIRTPGEFFGWSCLLDRTCYSASAESVVQSTVLKIAKDKLCTIMQKDPANGLIFYKNFAVIIGGRFIESQQVKDWFPSVEI